MYRAVPSKEAREAVPPQNIYIYIYAFSRRFYPKRLTVHSFCVHRHVRWVCWPCKNWDVFSFQELCTDPCNMGLCVIMLQHEVMVVDKWHNNGPQDLITVSLCIQNAINKIHLCTLSITYTCPYHNPTATMGHSIHNVDISKPLTHMMP